MSWRSTRAAGAGEAANRQVAVIDLGSNSWRVVVFTYEPGAWWKRTDELYETVRIGAGMESSGRLSEEAIVRGLETLAVFERFCHANGLTGDDVHVIATSAIRDASNQADFLKRRDRQHRALDRGSARARRGVLRVRRRDQHVDAERRRSARDRRRKHAAGPRLRPAGARDGVVRTRCRAPDRALPQGFRPGQEEGPSAACARTSATRFIELDWLTRGLTGPSPCRRRGRGPQPRCRRPARRRADRHRRPGVRDHASTR